MISLLVVILLCFIPSTVLFVGYGLLTRWYASLEGRVLFGLIASCFINFGLGLAVIAWPASFGPGGELEWMRTTFRIPIIFVLWGLVIVFVRAQARGRRGDRNGRGAAVESGEGSGRRPHRGRRVIGADEHGGYPGSSQ